ncbi:fimbrial protein [Hafnia paralvei]|uniref:Type 1 fimbrial protein subunit FimA n=2 Tax=Enterobacterales TaxID=91347 RepID=A0A4Q9ESB2_9GAMM|nr:fimbrial protein [Hafnia paralvei]ECI2867443.1 type-1 fimbrial protein subunit A [Salmonella enterica subsp. enterica]TBM28789.1 type 1 fimbrial protein subunit FimA [Hafnia paralvei]
MSFKKTAVCVALALASFASAGVMAADPVTYDTTAGKVHFDGSIVNTPCTITTKNADLTVTLGQVQKSVFATKGDTSPDVGIDIALDNCDVTTAKTAEVTFSGSAADDGTVLAIDAGGASGVAIEFAENSGTAMKLGVASSAQNLVSGSGGTINTLHYKAHYKSIVDLASITTGKATATADFTISYQ